MSAPVTTAQRFTRAHPCPVCGGSKDDSQGQGIRCWGFLSADGAYAHCVRAEHAGALTLHLDDTYVHRLVGDCRCGARHDPRPDLAPISSRSRSQIVASYDYRDESRTLLYQSVRYEPKAFKQRRPASGGDWTWSLNGTRRVPYRLPELLDADPERWVLLVEGEKDVDALIARGIVATTNAGGAGKWSDELSVYLGERRVAILPDNDAAGRKDAELKARSLAGIAAEVRVVTLPGLPEKGDVSDWLAAGGTVPDLQRLVRDAPAWTPRPETPSAASAGAGPQLVIRSIGCYETEAIVWLWPNWLARGELHLYVGVEGDGKGYSLSDIIARLSRGGQLPDGTYAPMCRVLMLTAEDSIERTVRPRLERHGAHLDNILILEAVADGDNRKMFSIAKHLPMLRAAVIEHRIDALVIDPLSSTLQHSDRNSEGEVRDLIGPLQMLGRETDVAVIGVGHLNRPNGTTRRPVQRILGSTGFGAVARVVWMVVPAGDETDATRRVTGVVKSNIAPKPEPLEWSIPAIDAPITWHGPSGRDMDELVSGGARTHESPERREILALLNGSDAPLQAATIAERLGRNPSTTRTLLRKMAEDRQVEQPARGVYASWGHRQIDNVDNVDSCTAQLSTLSTLSTRLPLDTE